MNRPLGRGMVCGGRRKCSVDEMKTVPRFPRLSSFRPAVKLGKTGVNSSGILDLQGTVVLTLSLNLLSQTVGGFLQLPRRTSCWIAIATATTTTNSHL